MVISDEFCVWPRSVIGAWEREQSSDKAHGGRCSGALRRDEVERPRNPSSQTHRKGARRRPERCCADFMRPAVAADASATHSPSFRSVAWFHLASGSRSPSGGVQPCEDRRGWTSAVRTKRTSELVRFQHEGYARRPTGPETVRYFPVRCHLTCEGRVECIGIATTQKEAAVLWSQLDLCNNRSALVCNGRRRRQSEAGWLKAGRLNGPAARQVNASKAASALDA